MTQAAARYPDETRAVLSVGGNDILTHPLPVHYDGWRQDVLDIDPATGAAIICDARDMQTLKPGIYDAIYCSHNLEHYFAHDVGRVLKGFLHVLKPDGFVEIWVPDLKAVMREVLKRDLAMDDVLYTTGKDAPILVSDVIYGWGAQIAQSGVDFYAHKTGFCRASLERAICAAGFAANYPVLRGTDLEIGILAFPQMPNAQRLRQFGIGS